MNKLDKVVLQYLKINTNNALLITGKWGVGKTYYYKNHLQPLISNTPTLNDSGVNYQPIYVSLFGIKSLEQLQTEIFLSLYPFLKTKEFKIGTSLGKVLLRGILQFNGLPDFTNIINDISIQKQEIVKYEKLIICLDDLERISPSIDQHDLIGFINTIIENTNIKMLIIGNETSIPGAHLSTLKDKVISNTIEYTLDLNSVFDSVINSKFAGSPSYTDFLGNEKRTVVSLYSGKTENLRTVIFSLSYFQNIYSIVSNFFSEKGIEEESGREVIVNLLKFTIAIALEYKSGNISYSDKKELNETKPLHIENSWNQLSKPSKGTHKYKTAFLSKYYPKYDYFFFDSIYHYITGGDIIESEILLMEIENNFHIEANHILPEYKVYKRLTLTNYQKLSDEEYIKLTKELFHNACLGLYEIGMYPQIFQMILRFNNPINFNIKEVENKIIQGIWKAKITSKFIKSLEGTMNFDEKTPFLESLTRIKEEALKVNEEIEKDSSKKVRDKLETLFYQDIQQFSLELYENQDIFKYDPLFNYFSVDRFANRVINSGNDFKSQLVTVLEERYLWNANSFMYLKEETLFFREVKQKLEDKLTKKTNVSGQLSQSLLSVLNSIVIKLSPEYKKS